MNNRFELFINKMLKFKDKPPLHMWVWHKKPALCSKILSNVIAKMVELQGFPKLPWDLYGEVLVRKSAHRPVACDSLT